MNSIPYVRPSITGEQIKAIVKYYYKITTEAIIQRFLKLQTEEVVLFIVAQLATRVHKVANN
jgi:hypothetical protein